MSEQVYGPFPGDSCHPNPEHEAKRLLEQMRASPEQRGTITLTVPYVERPTSLEWEDVGTFISSTGEGGLSIQRDGRELRLMNRDLHEAMRRAWPSAVDQTEPQAGSLGISLDETIERYGVAPELKPFIEAARTVRAGGKADLRGAFEAYLKAITPQPPPVVAMISRRSREPLSPRAALALEGVVAAAGVRLDSTTTPPSHSSEPGDVCGPCSDVLGSPSPCALAHDFAPGAYPPPEPDIEPAVGDEPAAVGA